MMTTLPNFLIIGSQKCGTTWLLRRLRQHPKVYMPEHEIHYFDQAVNFAKGVEWYQEQFSEAQGEVLIGEKTPDYLWTNAPPPSGHLPNTHERIYQFLPSAKLIVSLRNPVERAISAVNHMYRTQRLSPLERIDDLLVGNRQWRVKEFGVIDYGKYYQQLKAYLDYFDRSQILVLIFEEDIVQNPAMGLQKTCDFLEIERDLPLERSKKAENAYNYSKLHLILAYYAPVLSPLTKRINRFLPVYKIRPSERAIKALYDLYAEENEKLFDLLGYRPQTWLRQSGEQ